MPRFLAFECAPVIHRRRSHHQLARASTPFFQAPRPPGVGPPSVGLPQSEDLQRYRQHVQTSHARVAAPQDKGAARRASLLQPVRPWKAYASEEKGDHQHLAPEVPPLPPACSAGAARELTMRMKSLRSSRSACCGLRIVWRAGGAESFSANGRLVCAR